MSEVFNLLAVNQKLSLFHMYLIIYILSLELGRHRGPQEAFQSQCSSKS